MSARRLLAARVSPPSAGRYGTAAARYVTARSMPSCSTSHIQARCPSFHNGYVISPCGNRGFSTSLARRQEDTEEQKKEMDSGEQDIHDILTKQFQPKHLQVQDVSGGCGSFYSIAIISSKFKGMPTVKAHRMVNDALKDIIKGIHGLQLRTIPADD